MIFVQRLRPAIAAESMLHIMVFLQECKVDNRPEYRYSNPPRTGTRQHRSVPIHALHRARALIRADGGRLPRAGLLLPIQVLDQGVCSGKMRDLQLSRMKELDSTNRLSAKFSRGAT
jgi:hypothetical protein